jgi:PAS domain S-box-containing protein
LILGAAAIFALARSGALGVLFSDNYLPHRYCYLAQPGLVWTHVGADALIAASYTVLFACILLIVHKLRGLLPLRPYIWIFLSFATFIMACGLTHVMEVVTVWWPLYPLSAAMKAVCAAVSVPTALLFARVTPVIAKQIAGFFDLLASEQRAVAEAADFRDQIEAINRSQMMIEFGMDGTILRINDNVARRFGYTPAQMVGKHHRLILNDEDKGSQRQQELWDELRRGNFQSGEFRRVAADGRDVWVEVRYTPICGPDGRPRKVVGFATDETQRVAARIASEKKMRETEAQLRAIVDHVLVGIVMFDQTGTIVSINPEAVRIFGYEAGDAVGLNIRSLMPGSEAVPRNRHLGAHQPQGGSASVGVSHEIEGVTSFGRRFTVELTVTEVIGVGIRTFVGLVRDVTQRKRAEDERRSQEEALRKSEAFLERTGRLAGVGGWEVNLVTGQVTWSPETCRILGADPGYRPTLQDALDLYTPESKVLIDAAVERASTQGVGFDLELSLTGCDGRHLWARAVGEVDFADGRPTRLWGAFQDITARVAQRKALEEANARAALAAKSGGIGIWDWDLLTGKVTADDGMYRISGLDPSVCRLDDFEQWASCLHPEDRPRVEQALRDSVAQSAPFHTEYRVAWADGTLHSIESTGHVVQDTAGRPIRMVGTNRDITARQTAQETRRTNSDAQEQSDKAA